MEKLGNVMDERELTGFLEKPPRKRRQMSKYTNSVDSWNGVMDWRGTGMIFPFTGGFSYANLRCPGGTGVL